MNNSNIIDIKDIKERVKKLKKKATRENNIGIRFQRAFLTLEDKNRTELIVKLNNLEKYLSKTCNDTKTINKMIDDILDCNKSYFLSIYKRYLPLGKTKLVKDSIEQVMDYSIVSNGKRIRAFLIFLIFHLNNGIYYQNIEPFMLAIELIHAFSLIHDDLPALDNDKLRRGKPSTWHKFGEAEAILAGDAILNIAYGVMIDYFLYISDVDIKEFVGLSGESNLYDTSTFEVKKNDIFAFNLLQDILYRYQICMATLSAGTGVFGMISGEYNDIKYTHKKVTKDKIIKMYTDKTAVLIAVPMQIASLMSFVNNQNDLSSYTKIGIDLGVEYQLIDDLLGMTGNQKKLGKPVGSDKRNKKNLAIKNVKELEKKIHSLDTNINKLIDKLKLLDANKKRVFKAFVSYLTNRDH